MIASVVAITAIAVGPRRHRCRLPGGRACRVAAHMQIARPLVLRARRRCDAATRAMAATSTVATTVWGANERLRAAFGIFSLRLRMQNVHYMFRIVSFLREPPDLTNQLSRSSS